MIFNAISVSLVIIVCFEAIQNILPNPSLADREPEVIRITIEWNALPAAHFIRALSEFITFANETLLVYE